MNTPAAHVPVAVVGTGTMGQGIAQVALVAGHPVRLHDVVPGRAVQAAESIAARLDRLVAKARMTAAERDAAVARITPVEELTDLAPASLVVEAVAEQLAVKQRLFTDIEAVVADGCVLATNTSSLSVTAIAAALRLPGRFVGLHFFNPAPLLPLVEVVSGDATDPVAADFAYRTAAAWGKTPVRCSDTPGFVVNRIARPFYAEAFRTHEERAADPATVDAVLRECGGFRMGAFELTDLIGQDVNEAVTRSVWEAFFHDPKFAPSLAQRRLVESGWHGRKSGRGWFGYNAAAGAAGGVAGRPVPQQAEPAERPESVVFTGGPAPVRELLDLIEESGMRVERRDGGRQQGHLILPGGVHLGLTDGTFASAGGPHLIHFDLALDYRTATRVALGPSTAAGPEAVAAAVGLFQALGLAVSVIDDIPGLIVARTVAMLVDFALDAVARGVASAADVDTAMRLGVNYPAGPLEWGQRLTARWVYDLLRSLHASWPTGRYAPSAELTRRAQSGRDVLSS